ncbi:hypothetical protein Tco_1436819, partial [Tanacetum coccineum]
NNRVTKVSSSNESNKNLEPYIDYKNQAAGFPPLEAMNGKFINGRTKLDKILSLDSGESSRKQVNIRTFIALADNEADVVISKESFYDILITAFTEDDMSAIVTKIGTSLILDSNTTDICLKSRGRSSYARAMIELQADVELKDTLVVDIPKFDGEGRDSKLAKQGADSSVVSSAHESLHVPYDSLNTTSLVERIIKLERQILDGKLMLVDDDGKPLNKVDSNLVHLKSDSKVKVAYDETAQFMASGGANDGSLYKNEDYDIYDTYDIRFNETIIGFL